MINKISRKKINYQQTVSKRSTKYISVSFCRKCLKKWRQQFKVFVWQKKWTILDVWKTFCHFMLIAWTYIVDCLQELHNKVESNQHNLFVRTFKCLIFFNVLFIFHTTFLMASSINTFPKFEKEKVLNR